jgi:hypothetical protein
MVFSIDAIRVYNYSQKSQRAKKHFDTLTKIPELFQSSKSLGLDIPKGFPDSTKGENSL